MAERRVRSADWIQMLADIAQALSDSVSFTAGRSRPISGAVWRGVPPMPLTLTLSPAITAYNNGMMFRFVTGASPNTGRRPWPSMAWPQPPSS